MHGQLCNQPGCDSPHGAKGMCYMHYQRAKRGILGKPMKQPRGLTLQARFDLHYERGAPDECWGWSGPLQGGYGHIKRKRDGRFVSDPAPRVALELSLGRPLTGWALHTCDNGACVNPAHLYEGDALLNAQDAIARGRFHSGPIPQRNTAGGTRHALAKLSEADALEIRHLYSQGGISQEKLAQRFGIGQSRVSAVIRRRTWKHI